MIRGNYKKTPPPNPASEEMQEISALSEKLKEYGFKTFDKWWDESYDNEIDINKRFNKIVNILEEISEWDMDKCFEIKKEMQGILIHNYKHMFKTDEIYYLFNILKTDIKPKNNLI